MTALSGEHDACVAHLLALKIVNIWLTQRPDLPDGDDVYDIWSEAIRNSRAISREFACFACQPLRQPHRNLTFATSL